MTARAGTLVRRVAWIGFAIAVVAWIAFLRPTALGGSTTYVVVSGDSMLPTYHAGDLVVAQAIEPDRAGPAVGSIVVYRIPTGLPGEGRLIIHRIVGGDAGGYTTQGDHNAYVDIWHPTALDVVGAPAVLVPGAGNVIGVARQPIVAASIAALLAMGWLAVQRRKLSTGTAVRRAQAGSRRDSDVEYTPA